MKAFFKRISPLRWFLCAFQSISMMIAMSLAYNQYFYSGYWLSLVLLLVAWCEGSEGWGRRHAPPLSRPELGSDK